MFCFFFVFFVALLFVTPTPSCVRESLHLGKHCQQGVGSWNYNSIRWGDYLICTSILLFTLNLIPPCFQSNLFFSSVPNTVFLIPVYNMKWSQSFLHICSMLLQWKAKTCFFSFFCEILKKEEEIKNIAVLPFVCRCGWTWADQY